MQTIASRILDARNTAEGKIISVILSVLLAAMCFNVAIFTSEANAADEEATAETTTTEVEEVTEALDEVAATPTVPEVATEDATEPEIAPEPESDASDPNTESDAVEVTEPQSEEGNDSEEPEAPELIAFDEDSATLTISGTGEETITAADVAAYKTTAKKVVINNVGTIAGVAGEAAKGAFYGFRMETLEIFGVNKIEYAFASCTNMEKLTISSVSTIDANAFYNPAKLRTLTMSNVASIGSGVFTVLGGATELTSVTLSGLSICDQMFMNHNKLTDLSLTNIDTIGFQAFMNCTSLTSLDLSGVAALGISAFLGCTGLTEIELDGVEISNTAFFGCTGLQKVEIKNADTIGISAFFGCTGLQDFTVDNVATIGSNIFANCAGPETLTLKNVPTIGNSAFSGCSGLKTLNLDTVASVGQYAFSTCEALETVNMTGIAAIENFAFWNCKSLTTIDSLNNVDERIGGFAFYGCESLDLSAFDAEAFGKMGYIGTSDEIMKRVLAILEGQFELGNAKDITDFEKQWSDGIIDQSDNWNTYENGTQIRQEVSWENEADGVAQAEVSAYYTGKRQMDYIFVADLSASMAQIGNLDEDDNARFYEMQSKLLNMADKLLNTPGYDCRISIVTFGGYVTQKGSCETLSFTSSYEEVLDFILNMKPLNENTDYGIGLNGALEEVEAQTEGRNISMIFLSDGRPTYDGETKLGTVSQLKENDAKVAALAEQIREAGVSSIYGVLHTPGTGANVQYAENAMGAICDEYYASKSHADFSAAMNTAFAYGGADNEITVTVNAKEFDISNIHVIDDKGTTVEVKEGDIEYIHEENSPIGTIKWKCAFMPFTTYKLVYNMTLKPELAMQAGSHEYTLNGEGTTGFTHEGGATIDLGKFRNQLTLQRTYTPPTTTIPPTTDPVIPPVTDVTTGGTGAGAGAGAAAAGAGAAAAAVAAPTPAAAPVEDITDDATPMAQSPEGEGEEGEGEEEIIDDANPLGAFDVKHCSTHWFMLFGMLLTAGYGVAAALRRKNFADDLEDFEKSITGETAKQRSTVSVPSASHQAI